MTADGGTALVLGGGGFVGRHVCRAFSAAGHDVVRVSRTPPPKGSAEPGVALDLLTAPPRDLMALLRTVRPAVVVNATGAVWDVTLRQMTAVNVRLVRRLTAALAAQDEPPRLVQLGSVYEYGPVPRGTPLDEAAPERPGSAYGRTKLRGSRLVLDAAAQGRLDAVVLRLSNVVGPGSPRSSLLGRVAGQLADAARRGTPALLRLAPLRAERDFVDVRDVTDAVVAAASRPVTGRVLNVGRGEAVHVRRMVDGLIEASGVRALIVEEGGDEVRGAGLERQEVDCTAARAALGWAARRDLDESLRALWHQASNCQVSRAS